MPPITAAIVPILASIEILLAPVLGAYLPALNLISQVFSYLIPLVLAVHAIDSLRLASSWFSGKSLKTFKPLSSMLQPLAFTLPNNQAATHDPHFMENVFNPSFTNTLSFATNVLRSIETSAQLYG